MFLEDADDLILLAEYMHCGLEKVLLNMQFIYLNEKHFVTREHTCVCSAIFDETQLYFEPTQTQNRLLE